MDSGKNEPLLMEPPSDQSSSETSQAHRRASDTGTRKMDRTSKPPRKRSRIACTWCRDRKVRCDASSHGVPCTNCELDQQECVVHAASQNRPNRTRRPKFSRHQPYPSPTLKKSNTSVFEESGVPSDSPLLFQNWHEGGKQFPWGTPLPQPMSPGTISDVFYTHHTFLKLPGLSDLPREDYQYLNSKGCFRVPGGAVLDEFVRSYFMYVHPSTPVMNEATFWRMYYGKTSAHQGEDSKISLFVFQAMLFASCPFVAPAVLHAAGFQDLRAARNMLYTRAKLLYDLNCEPSPRCITQASLLLSHHLPSSDFHAGSLWLSISVQNLVVANALDPTPNPATANLQKRIWWGIVLRDRILSLGLGRQPQLVIDGNGKGTRNDGSIATVLGGDVLGEEDLEEEFDASEVYDPETKRNLAKVLTAQCELAICLGNVLALVNPSSSTTASGFSLNTGRNIDDLHLISTWSGKHTVKERSPDDIREQAAKCRADLLRWSTNAKGAMGSVVNSNMTHESVNLQFGLAFFYHHAARLALSNFEALSLQQNDVSPPTDTEVIGTGTTVASKDTEADYYRIRDELEDASGCITDTIKRFLAQGIAQYLPIIALPLIAHPLLLSALDVKLSSTKSQSATRKRRFRYYANLMQVFQSRYDGTDAIAAFIQRTLILAEDLLPPSQMGRDSATGSRRCNSWSELFCHRPEIYLRLSLALNSALKRGYFPQMLRVHRHPGEHADVTIPAENPEPKPNRSSNIHGLSLKREPELKQEPWADFLKSYSLTELRQSQVFGQQPYQATNDLSTQVGIMASADPALALNTPLLVGYDACLGTNYTHPALSNGYGLQDYGVDIFQEDTADLLESMPVGPIDTRGMYSSGSDMEFYPSAVAPPLTA
ncbi:Zn(II)2Cys6 transcription factor [Aspergillus stella-maris]|uniref:Zn(II)2Cys6 transcription factor n=1 Tax=Aspergillus stella-maris TaxID=1810926 RepID=UPI003CCDEF58